MIYPSPSDCIKIMINVIECGRERDVVIKAICSQNACPEVRLIFYSY